MDSSLINFKFSLKKKLYLMNTISYLNIILLIKIYFFVLI